MNTTTNATPDAGAELALVSELQLLQAFFESSSRPGYAESMKRAAAELTRLRGEVEALRETVRDRESELSEWNALVSAAFSPDQQTPRLWPNSWKQEVSIVAWALHSFRADNARLATNAAQLRAFAADVLDEFWEGGMDGSDLQDIGEKHGLLIKTEMAERCSDEEGGCSCAEAGADFPTECYRYAPILATAPATEGTPTTGQRDG